MTGWKSFVPFMKSGSTASMNYPTPRATGFFEMIKDKLAGLRNKRTTAGGGYEDTRADGPYTSLGGGRDGIEAGASGRGRGRGGGLEDDVWDERVDRDPYGAGSGAYNEEAELGLAPTPGVYTTHGTDYMQSSTAYTGASAPALAHPENAARGRSATRDLDPFDDHHEASSLRSVSPRPHVSEPNTSSNGAPGGHGRHQSSLELGLEPGESSRLDSKNMRKSQFHEQI